METTELQGIAQALVLARDQGAATAEAIQIESAKFLRVPKDWDLQDVTAAVEGHNERPYRPRGTIQLHTLQSFIDMSRELSASQGVRRTYLDCQDPTKPPRFITVLNDHGDDGVEFAGWRDYQLVYEPPFSEEWRAWMGKNRQAMTQDTFAEFIEDRAADIGAPGSTVMLAVATTLQAKTGVSFSSAKRLDNGETQLVYTETIDASASNGSVQIPKEFELVLRVFDRDAAYPGIKTRLKYRLSGARVSFVFEIDRPERLIADAIEHMVKTAVDSGVSLIYGSPAK